VEKMVLDITTILSSAATGAVTGYLTNNLALNMIFKEYGPFGGVVIKTKAEFIKSISELVERDIINHQTLKEEFNKDEFRESLNKTASDFIDTYLFERSSRKRLAEFSGWEQNYDVISSYFADNLPLFIQKLVIDLKKKLKLEDLIEKDDLKSIVDKFYSYLLGKADDKDIFKNLIFNFYKELGDKRLADLLSEDSQTDFHNFIKRLTKELHLEEEISLEKEEELKNDLKSIININDFTANIYSELEKVKIDDIIKDRKDLEFFFEDDKFKELIQEILINLKIEMKNSDLIVDDLLNEEIKSHLNSDLDNILKIISSQISGFIAENKDDINSFIFAAIEEEIELSSGLKAMSRAGIYNKYKENIDEYGNPADLIMDYLNNNFKENENLRSDTADKLKNIELSFLSSYINSDRISEQIEELIIELLKNNRSLALLDIVSEDIITGTMFEEKIYDILFQTVRHSLTDPEILSLVSNYSFNMKLNQLLDEQNAEKISETLSEYLISLLKNNEEIRNYIFNFLNNNSFELTAELLKNNKDQISDITEEEFNKNKKNIAEKKIEDIYKIFHYNQRDVNSLTDFISTFLYSNLPGMLEGRIAQAASANLNRLSDQEVQQAIEDFMGKELKPITYLGAVLGAAAGLAFSISGAEVFFTAADPEWLKYLSSALLYGGVGWLTNVLAIWMIFHPYQEKRIASVKLPFTPGVVAKNKGRFALSMGDFVEKELLKANSAAELIEENRVEIVNNSLDFCKKDDFQFLFQLLKDNDQLAAALLYNLIKKRTASLNSKEVKLISEKSNLFLEKIIKANLKNTDYHSILLDSLVQKEMKIDFSLRSLLDSADIGTLSSFAAGDYKLELSSARFKKIIMDRSLFPVFKHFLPFVFNKNIDFNIKESSLNLLRKNRKTVLNISKDWLYSQEENTARKVNFKKDELLEKEKEKKGGLLKNTLISGALFMADLDEFVDSVVKRIFNEKLPDFFDSREAELIEEIDNLVLGIQKTELKSLENEIIAETASDFIQSEKGQKLINEVIYLSDTEIEKIINELLNEDQKKLFDLKFSISDEKLKDFITEHLTLEQKLKILLIVKKLLSDDNLNRELKYILRNDQLKEVINESSAHFIDEVDLKNSEFINIDQLNNILININNLLDDKQVESKIESYLQEEVNNLADHLDQKMDYRGLEEILSLIIESGIDSLKVNSEQMLSSLNLKELTAEEVQSMDPAEIEAVFDSFAGKYFSHLKQYGWFGGIFGVLQILIRSLI
jgi:uncharacterized membrane protein YheB (UPF0754 family)